MNETNIELLNDALLDGRVFLHFPTSPVSFPRFDPSNIFYAYFYTFKSISSPYTFLKTFLYTLYYIFYIFTPFFDFSLFYSFLPFYLLLTFFTLYVHVFFTFLFIY